MRFMLLVKGDARTEAGVMPTEAELAEMTRYNEELVKAGVLLAGEGLHPTSRGARVRYEGDKRTVIDGPFTEAKELIAGFWIIEAKSLEEAVEWARRVPAREGEVEVRQILDDDDFGEEFTPELREREHRMRRQIAEQHPDL